jgi:hypothetical protein
MKPARWPGVWTRVPQARPKENGLPRVGVPQPLVGDEHSQEFAEVGDGAQECIGEKVVNREAGGIAWVLGSEVPARFNRKRREPSWR